MGRMKYYITFKQNTIHRNSFAVVTASNKQVVQQYTDLFPGYSMVYSEADWEDSELAFALQRINATEILP